MCNENLFHYHVQQDASNKGCDGSAGQLSSTRRPDTQISLRDHQGDTPARVDPQEVVTNVLHVKEPAKSSNLSNFTCINYKT